MRKFAGNNSLPHAPMENTDVKNIQPSEPDNAPETTPQPTEPKRRSRRIPMAVLSLLFTVGGWLMLPFVYQVSLACGALGFVTGVIGWCGRRGAWRNLSITCTVAALALLLVFATFWGAIVYIAS